MEYRPVILLLGTKLDWHIESLQKALERSNRAIVKVIDYKCSSVEFRSDSKGRFTVIVDGYSVPTYAAVFDKILIFSNTDFSPDVPEEFQDFACAEWLELYHLISMVFGDQVINTLSARSNISKPYQQLIAASVGFSVPETVVSNDKRAFECLFERGAETAVVKALGKPQFIERLENVSKPTVVMTSRVTKEDLDDSEEREFTSCPQLFQSEIIKDYELRVIWILGRLFAFRINSQEMAHSLIDWRHGSQDLNFQLVEVERLLIDRIGKFMEKMKLAAGSLDIIIDQQGKAWFLECNDQGAWGWLDDTVDGQIMDAWVQTLCGRAEAQASEAKRLANLDLS